jgi:hypothetical protein
MSHKDGVAKSLAVEKHCSVLKRCAGRRGPWLQVDLYLGCVAEKEDGLQEGCRDLGGDHGEGLDKNSQPAMKYSSVTTLCVVFWPCHFW